MKDALISGARIGLSVLIVAGLAMSGVALADTGTATGPQTTTAPRVAPDTAGKPVPRPIRGEALELLASLTALTVDQVRDELRSGATPGEVVEANGSSSDALVDGLVGLVEARTTDATIEGAIDQDRADRIVARATDRIGDFVDRPVGERVRKVKARRHLLSILDLTPAAAAAAIEAGATPLDLLSDAGYTADSFIEAVIAAPAERSDSAVAAGKITQDDADRRIATIEDRLRSWVESDGAD